MTNEKTIETLAYAWKIDNFTSYYEKLIRSPTFDIECLQTSLILELNPSSLSLYLRVSSVPYHVCNNKLEIILLDYKITITLKNGKILTTFRKEKLTVGRLECTGYVVNFSVDQKKEIDKILIYCVLTVTNPNYTQVNDCVSRTEIGVKRCLFQCDIENIDCANWTLRMKCPFPEMCPIEITLTSPEDDIVMHVNLLEKHPNTERLVKSKITLLDGSAITTLSVRDEFLFKKGEENNNWKLPSFISKSKLNEKRKKFFNKCIFSLMCDFSTSNPIISNEIVQNRYYNLPCTNPKSNKDTISTLHHDLRTMLYNEEHSDVKLRTGGEEFSGHKFLLVSRSPVFSAMFKQDMVENQTDVVEISDADVSTLKAFLEFLYTDSVSEMNYETSSKLLILAEKYQVLLLKEKCATFLVSSLSVSNVCDTLRMADMVGHELLKSSAINYIKLHSREIFLSSDWRELIVNNCQLVTEVLSKFSVELGKTAK